MKLSLGAETEYEELLQPVKPISGFILSVAGVLLT